MRPAVCFVADSSLTPTVLGMQHEATRRDGIHYDASAIDNIGQVGAPRQRYVAYQRRTRVDAI